jgi:hypothetical protein
LVIGASNAVLEASNVIAAPAFAVGDLHSASVVAPYVVWNIFSGPAACFGEYKVQYSPESDFSIASHISTIVVPSLKTTNIQVPSASGFASGDTIYFRVLVVRTIGSTTFLVAQTSGTPPSFTY